MTYAVQPTAPMSAGCTKKKPRPSSFTKLAAVHHMLLSSGCLAFIIESIANPSNQKLLLALLQQLNFHQT